MAINPTERFSNRVADYINYRPRYPHALIDFAREALRLTRDHIVADIGSGTGFLAELFLENGNQVIGIEPNREMREAGERLLARYPNFESLDAKAEETTLPTASVDFITAGQAFHWFNPLKAKAEFGRILRPGGYVLLVWNERQVGTTPFLRDYEELIRTYANDYGDAGHRNLADNNEEALRDFFAPDEMHRLEVAEQAQRFDFDGLKGRLLSSSYMPVVGDPTYDALLAALHELFEKHQSERHVRIEYDTMLYYGHLDRGR